MARVERELSLVRAAQEKDDFAFDGFGGVVGEELRAGAVAVFLKGLGQLAGDAELPLREVLGADCWVASLRLVDVPVRFPMSSWPYSNC